jgi:hypothetical protein
MCNCSFVATSVYVQYYTKLHNVQLNMLIFKCDYVEISYLITHHADRNSHNICTITYCVISYKRDNGTWRARRNCILFNVQLHTESCVLVSLPNTKHIKESKAKQKMFK